RRDPPAFPTRRSSDLQAFGRIAPTGLPCAVHSEDDDLIEARTAELRARGEVGPGAHQESRPDFVEALAVSKVLLLAEALGVRLRSEEHTSELQSRLDL